MTSTRSVHHLTVSPTTATSSASDFVPLPWHELAERALASHPILWLVGPPGCGKTRFCQEWARRRGVPAEELQGDPKADFYAFWGRPALVGAETRFLDGPLTRALKHGGLFVLNDAALVPSPVLSALLPLREASMVTNPVSQEALTVPAGFRIVLTSNPENYRCRPNRTALEALVDGSLVLQVPPQTTDQVVRMLRARFPNLGKGIVEQAVSAWEKFATLATSSGKDEPPQRLGFRAVAQFLALVACGARIEDATTMALVDKYFLDPEAHSAARLRQGLGGED